MKILKYTRLLLLTLLLINASVTYAQQPEQIVVTGIVLSGETSSPLTGASVVIKGNKKGAITKSDGRFKMKLQKGQTLVFSYVGFEKFEQKFNKSDSLIVSLKLATNDNEEVVVIGYGTRKKSHMTGAVSKLNPDEYMGQMPVSRADDALKGKVAGLSIATTDAQAGAAPTIQIRGATSISAGTDPLIVIDGYPVPTDLSSIDMNDVESIEVLKDAASAAIYGSRGGNGVIIITTKSGKNAKGKLSINVFTGLKNVYIKASFPTFRQWTDYVKSINNGNLTPELVQAQKFDANTDAQDYTFRQVNYTSIQAGLSGGNAGIKYYLSGNALLDNGVMIGNDFKKFGLRANLQAKPWTKTTVEFTFTPSFTETFNVPITVQEALRNLPPWMPAYHNDTTSKYTGMPVGSVANQRDFSEQNPKYIGIPINSSTNNSPLQQLNGTTDRTTNVRAITNLSIKQEITKSLSFKATFGILYGEQTREFFQSSWAQSSAAIDGYIRARASSFATLTRSRTFDFNNEYYLAFKKSVRKNDFDAVAGFSYQYTNQLFFNARAGNFPSDDISTLNAGVMQALTSTVVPNTLVSYFARFNYAYDNKYLFSVADRYDASSRFGPDNRWAHFPSASLGWRVSNEKFFPNNKWVGDLKLRASVGVTGNRNIGDFRYIANVSPTYVILGNEATPAYQLTSFNNPQLGWEQTIATNFGLDLSLFNNKYKLSAEIFRTETKDLLLDLPILSSVGFTNYLQNRGKLQTNGFELEIAGPVIVDKNFKWTFNANAFTAINKLIDFGGTQSQINQGDPKRPNFFLTRVNEPLVQYYGYVADSAVLLRNTPNFNADFWPVGVTPLHTFVKNMDGKDGISDSDRVVLGNPYPKFNWGFTNNFMYKNFDFSFTFQGSHGAKVFNIDPYYFETQFSGTGSTAYQNTDLYTIDQQKQVRQKSQTNLFIQDASFIALRNINLGYTFNSKKIKKVGINKLRTFVTATNLLYIFADSYTSFNPEGDNGFNNDPLRKGYQRGSVPLARTIAFGVNVEF